MSAPHRLTQAKLRVHWMRAQGLIAPISGTIEDVVAATGWVRTLGGVDVYLALRARVPNLTRAALDQAASEQRVMVLPSARSCIYLVPRAHAALALRLADDLSRKRTERDLDRVSVGMPELQRVAEAVVTALSAGPMGTDALRKALPAGTVRSLGEAGKKAGISSTLPPAMRWLEFEGRVERTLEGGRLDSERYVWRLPAENPFVATPVSDDPAERHAQLAAIFFSQMGATTARDFAEWSGLSLKDAKAAVERNPQLVPVSVDGYAEDAYAPEASLADLTPVAEDHVVLLPSMDNLVSVHGGPRLLMDARFHSLEVDAWGPTRAQTLGTAKFLNHRPIIAGDRLVGFWDIDPDTREFVAKGFAPFPAPVKTAVEAEGERVRRFLLDELGHTKRFAAMDTVEDQRSRVAFIRAL